MLVTLFTDASFCPNLKIGTWAAWAKCNGKTMRNSGVFKDYVSCSQVAEIKAILNGIYLADKFFNCGPLTKFIVQTDCKLAISALTKVVKGKWVKKEELEFLAKKYQELKRNKEIEFRWVKAHIGTVTPRHAVNTFCDAECFRLLNEERKKISAVC